MRLLLIAFAFIGAVGLARGAERDSPRELPAGVLAVLEKADTLELLSLSPEKPGKKDDPKTLHGWTILGKTALKDAAVRSKVLNAVKKGVADNDGSVAKCFQPRHALRATHGGQTVALLICFQCLQIRVYDGDTSGVLTTRSPEPVLDKVLKDAGVPLAPKDRE